MKIKNLMLIGMVALNAALAVAARQQPSQPDNPLSLEAVEDIFDVECYSGGKYSTKCSIEAGISWGGSVTRGCCVSCTTNSYACCHLECECIPY